MGMIHELQQSAIGEPCLVAVRKAKLLASRLNLNSVSVWLEHELNGYETNDPLPEYRVLLGCLCYYSSTPIPDGLGYAWTGTKMLRQSVAAQLRQPLGDLEALADTRASHIHLVMTGETADETRRQFSHWDYVDSVTFGVSVSRAAMAGISDHVKNRVLTWASELERAGITGDGQSFSDVERATASHITFNIYNSVVDQISASGTNQKQVR